MENMEYSKHLYKTFMESLLVSLSLFAILLIIQLKGIDIGLYDIDIWRYVHIGDANENIKNALFLAKGGKLNEYVTSNHMPGVYLYLSLFFSILPNDFFSNSASNAIVIQMVSQFVSIFTIVVLSFFSIRLVVKEIYSTFFLKFLFCLIFLNLFVFYDYTRVLSETYLPFLQLTYLSLFYYYLSDRKLHFAYLVAAIYFIALSIFFGLTNVFTDLIFLVSFLFFLLQDIKKIKFLHFIPAVIILVFLFFKSGNLNFQYWIIETNKAQGLGSGFQMLNTIWSNISFFPSNIFNIHSFGPVYDHRLFVCALGCICIYLCRQNLVLVSFLGITILILPLDSWRIPEMGNISSSQTYKTDVNMGVCFFFLLIIGQKSIHRIESVFLFAIKKFSFNFGSYGKRWLVLLIVFISLTQVLSFVTQLIEIKKTISLNHSTWIAQENLCKQKFVKPNHNCSCLSVMHWDQEFFLINNVRPCANQFSSYSPHLNSDDTYFKTVEASFVNKEGAFLLNHTDLYTDKSILSDRLVQLFQSGECKSVYTNLLYLCKSKK
ncbi:hypothetical protein JWG41_07365 [Leptospira sp. 201903075]|uniref:hypothetical protein n=1 Tax=Leptospira chreensis TaxID=2810035 RepID=UPI00196260F6|nr:hypothetical protein [Leptospira chreensis]MBM9590258.1 hypothetical protein [Leptospira chreensis]